MKVLLFSLLKSLLFELSLVDIAWLSPDLDGVELVVVFAGNISAFVATNGVGFTAKVVLSVESSFAVLFARKSVARKVSIPLSIEGTNAAAESFSKSTKAIVLVDDKMAGLVGDKLKGRVLIVFIISNPIFISSPGSSVSTEVLIVIEVNGTVTNDLEAADNIVKAFRDISSSQLKLGTAEMGVLVGFNMAFGFFLGKILAFSISTFTNKAFNSKTKNFDVDLESVDSLLVVFRGFIIDSLVVS